MYMPVTLGATVQNTFSFGLAVDERTRNKLYGVKCRVHIFSGSFGSAVDKKRGITEMRVRAKSGPVFRSLYSHVGELTFDVGERLHTLTNWSLVN